MARINHVASARPRKEGKPAFRCYTCHTDIEAGQAYAWCQPSRFSSRYNWHAKCAPPPPSALESNDKRAEAMAAFENAYDTLEGFDAASYDSADEFKSDVEAMLSDLADGLNNAAEMWREAASNIEDGFGHPTYQSEEMESNADEVESVASEVESLIDQIDEFDDEGDLTLVEWIADAIETMTSNVGNQEGSLP